ncbi:hypothetical protein EJ08DRAFT_731378 [Tothia fuscella]|uniref:Uncharacterized protein n=1 Tax=Tothia fuscella TaxID=1048955 RepID=A0A9P4NWT6_9PEZI|nr:hypothetical protein EJ08DRAFT_731378 [Tothia fuscella]
MASSTTMAPRPGRPIVFLSLAPEIRNLIYEYALLENDIDKDSHVRTPIFENKRTYPAKANIVYTKPPTLAFTCTQICREMATMWMKEGLYVNLVDDLAVSTIERLNVYLPTGLLLGYGSPSDLYASEYGPIFALQLELREKGHQLVVHLQYNLGKVWVEAFDNYLLEVRARTVDRFGGDDLIGIARWLGERARTELGVWENRENREDPDWSWNTYRDYNPISARKEGGDDEQSDDYKAELGRGASFLEYQLRGALEEDDFKAGVMVDLDSDDEKESEAVPIAKVEEQEMNEQKVVKELVGSEQVDEEGDGGEYDGKDEHEDMELVQEENDKSNVERCC